MTTVRVKLTAFIIKINGYWILPTEGEAEMRPKASESSIAEEDVVNIVAQYFVAFRDNSRQENNVKY